MNEQEKAKKAFDEALKKGAIKDSQGNTYRIIGRLTPENLEQFRTTGQVPRGK